MSDIGLDIDSLFPYSSYRRHQRPILVETVNNLFNKGFSNVVVCAPTGIGKSAINTAVARKAEDAFITTPQKKLRKQLENDEDLNSYYKVLRSRQDYICKASDTEDSEAYSSRNCPIYLSKEKNCIETEECEYWKHKRKAINSDVATITFAYLIYDSYLPSFSHGEKRSFSDRELLVVDECHRLEQQTASLFAGYTISPYTLPETVFRDMYENIDPSTKRFDEIKKHLEEISYRAEKHIEEMRRKSVSGLKKRKNIARKIEQCRSFLRRYNYCLDEVKTGRDWVVDIDKVEYKEEERYSISLSPVDVDRFLQRYVWCRGDKRILSTATMPYLDSPDRWIEDLGLRPENTKIIKKPMPFNPSNRPIYTDYMIDRFTDGSDKKYWDNIVKAIESLYEKHKDEKGLIHTTSYERAEKLYNSLSDKSILHKKDPSENKNIDWVIYRWQENSEEKNMLLSPSFMDGIDLPDEKCRWQVLVKVPYPNPKNSRIDFLLNERDDWRWYYEVTAQKIIQSVGRGIRHKNDYCRYYILDKSFIDVMNKAYIPEWFQKAIK